MLRRSPLNVSNISDILVYGFFKQNVCVYFKFDFNSAQRTFFRLQIELIPKYLEIMRSRMVFSLLCVCVFVWAFISFAHHLTGYYERLRKELKSPFEYANGNISLLVQYKYSKRKRENEVVFRITRMQWVCYCVWQLLPHLAYWHKRISEQQRETREKKFVRMNPLLFASLFLTLRVFNVTNFNFSTHTHEQSHHSTWII